MHVSLVEVEEEIEALAFIDDALNTDAAVTFVGGFIRSLLLLLLLLLWNGWMGFFLFRTCIRSKFLI